VVAVLGNATSAGDVDSSVVAVFGDSHVTGHAGDVVAVMGNVFVNSRVDRSVVAVMGSIELGPSAEIGGDVAVIGGELIKDPRAIVHGGIENVLGGLVAHLPFTHAWLHRCLLYGRPLALGPGLEWAWGLALGFLVLYVLLGLLFPRAIEQCATTFERHPGESLVTSLAAILLGPVVTILLLLTLIGVLAVPFLVAALIGAVLFGKAGMLAWIGRRCAPFLGSRPPHTVLAILVGGALVLALYCVPIVGFIVWFLLALLALGVALYATLLAGRAARGTRPLAFRPPPQMPPPPREPPPAGAFDPLGAAQQARSASDSAASADAAAPGPAAPGAGGPGANASAGPSGAGAAAAPALSPMDLLALPRAGFWPRMGGLLIDLVLVGMLFGWSHRGNEPQLILLALYGAVMWKLKGATVGGLICGLRVVRADGREIDWPTAIVRALGCFLSLAVIGLGFIWIAIDEHQQAWHDKIAGTLVVRVPPGMAHL
jgi:uncharacterized RDD family membrane protein YckC